MGALDDLYRAPSEFEAAGRAAKAYRLACFLGPMVEMAGAAPVDLHLMPERIWVEAAVRVGVRVPSLETRAAVVGLLEAQQEGQS